MEFNLAFIVVQWGKEYLELVIGNTQWETHGDICEQYAKKYELTDLLLKAGGRIYFGEDKVTLDFRAMPPCYCSEEQLLGLFKTRFQETEIIFPKGFKSPIVVFLCKKNYCAVKFCLFIDI